MRWLEHLIPPPLVALLIGLAMWSLSRASAPLALDPWLRIGGAIVLFGLGLCAAAPAIVAFRRQGANIDPHRPDRGEVLVTDGVFRLTRNPMYLGVALALCAYAFYLARPIAALGPIGFVLFITRFQILPEERAMLAKFGERYAAYRRATRRWF